MDEKRATRPAGCTVLVTWARAVGDGRLEAVHGRSRCCGVAHGICRRWPIGPACHRLLRSYRAGRQLRATDATDETVTGPALLIRRRGDSRGRRDHGVALLDEGLIRHGHRRAFRNEGA